MAICCCQAQQRRTISLDGSLSGYMLLSGTAEEEDNRSLCGPEWLHVGCSCQHESTISIYVSLSG